VLVCPVFCVCLRMTERALALMMVGTDWLTGTRNDTCVVHAGAEGAIFVVCDAVHEPLLRRHLRTAETSQSDL
jgi:hypothetical protein